MVERAHLTFYASCAARHGFMVSLLPPCKRYIFCEITITTSAVSSTNLGSILIFASCVLYRSPVFSKFHKSKPNLR